MHRPRHPLLLLLPAFLACSEDQSPTAPAGPEAMAAAAAGPKVVNSLADPGDGSCTASQCTLREAINDPTTSAISFAAGLTGTITLARPVAGGGTLRLTRSVTITGPSRGIVIRRRSVDPAFRILRIDEGVAASLENLTISGGRADSGSGAAIVNRGSLSLIHCTVSGNTGTAIANYTSLTLRRTMVEDNTGTGISNNTDGSLELHRSSVSRNGGGGIGNGGGDVTLTLSTVSENSLGGLSSARGRITLTESRITDNDESGISSYLATIVLTNSSVARNRTATDGGGIHNEGGDVKVVGSTIANNSAVGNGGAIFNTVPHYRQGVFFSLINSTVSGNVADSGGAIMNSASFGGISASLRNSTVTLNSARKAGGGIRHDDGGDATNDLALTNTIVAQNTAPEAPDVSAISSDQGFVFASFNLIGNGDGTSIANGENGNHVGSASARINARLAPLALNGGPTRTHALLAGSPAIDAGAATDCEATDQRGVSRPQGAGCDIGSYEREE